MQGKNTVKSDDIAPQNVKRSGIRKGAVNSSRIAAGTRNSLMLGAVPSGRTIRGPFFADVAALVAPFSGTWREPMSTAAAVPATHDLEGDDAVETLRSVGLRELLRDSLLRFRLADGFSHSRALAFQFALTLVPALIAVVGFAHELGQQKFSLIVSQTFRDLAPGPAGEVFTQAIDQGSERDSGTTALILGLAAAIVAGVTAMGQIERGSNRIYGVERDRPTLAKYSRATVLALTAGVASLLAMVLMVAGSEIGSAAKDVTGWNDTLDTAWAVGRWPLGALLVAGAIALLFMSAPRRDQPSFSWLVLGSSIAVVLWFAFTGLLAAYIGLSQDFGETYGPLAGVIGLLLWTFGSAMALFLGLAVAAQLEAVRAGSPDPGAVRPAESS